VGSFSGGPADLQKGGGIFSQVIGKMTWEDQGLALVLRGFNTKYTSVCKLICATLRPYSTIRMNVKSGNYNGPRKPAELRLSVLTIMLN